jgi:bifunctional lysine-specific demethylase and histidyl-hydroxylase NO66
VSGTAEAGAALRRCTGLSRTDFEREHWSRALLLSRHDEGFTDLLGAAAIDELVAERGLRSPFFRVVRSGQPVGGVTRTAKAGSRQITDLVDPEAVRDAFADGATLVLNSLHRIHPPLVRFCRELAYELGHATQCNAYVTPPGAQGFAPHHDTHDVFVLHVDGHKRWHVYEPRLALPLKSQPSQQLTDDGEPLVTPDAEPLLSVELGPGDALYLPRGYIHAAETNTDRSIHLTIGVLAATRYDVLRDVIALAADRPSFRQALPLGDADTQLAAVADVLREAADWLQHLPEADAMEAVRSRLSTVGGSEPLGLLAADAAVRGLDKERRVRPRTGTGAELVDGDQGRVLLRTRDRELSLPDLTRPALVALLAGPQRVGDLDLPVDDALVLVRRLLREGILVVADPA